MLVGRYEAGPQMLTAERDVSVRIADGETRFLSRTSLVIGRVLVEVFADPWRDDPPEPAEDTVTQLVPLVGNHARKVTWPPARSIDDTRSVDAPPGSEIDTPAPSGNDEAGDEHQPVPWEDTDAVTDRTPTAPRPVPVPRSRSCSRGVTHERAERRVVLGPAVGEAGA